MVKVCKLTNAYLAFSINRLIIEKLKMLVFFMLTDKLLLKIKTIWLNIKFSKVSFVSYLLFLVNNK